VGVARRLTDDVRCTVFLSCEDVTNAQDEAPMPVKPRPSVGRSSLTAEHEQWVGRVTDMSSVPADLVWAPV